MDRSATRPRGWEDVLLLAALATLWGTAFGFNRVALEDLSPVGLTATRLVVAAAALQGVRAVLGLPFPRDARLWGRFAVMAVFGTLAPFLLVSWGQERVASGLAGMLMAATPLAAMVLAHGFVPGEPLTQRKLLGVLLGLAGVVLLLGPGSLLQLADGESLARPLAVLAGAVCYAIHTVLTRRLPPIHPVVYASSVMLVGAVLALPWAGSEGASALGARPRALGAAVWLGLVPTGLATLLHHRLVVRAGAGFTALAGYAIPVVALVVGVVVFGERAEILALAGLALVLAGIASARQPPPELASQARDAALAAASMKSASRSA